MHKINISSKKLLLTISFLILTTLIYIVDSQEKRSQRKRKPKEKPKKKVYNPRDRKPLRISDELYCQICKDIVKETAYHLYNKKRDYEVIDAIEGTCELPTMYPIRN